MPQINCLNRTPVDGARRQVGGAECRGSQMRSLARSCRAPRDGDGGVSASQRPDRHSRHRGPRAQCHAASLTAGNLVSSDIAPLDFSIGLFLVKSAHGPRSNPRRGCLRPRNAVTFRRPAVSAVCRSVRLGSRAVCFSGDPRCSDGPVRNGPIVFSPRQAGAQNSPSESMSSRYPCTLPACGPFVAINRSGRWLLQANQTSS